MGLSKGKAGIILTITAGVGLVTSVVLTAKKAPEAEKLKAAALEEKRKTTGDPNVKLTWVESMRATAGCYVPVFISTAVTAGSIIGAQVLPQSAMNELKKMHNTYKDIVAKVESKEAAEKIEEIAQAKLEEDKKAKKSTDGKSATSQRFAFRFEGLDPIEFTATLVDVMEAEYLVNREFKILDGGGEITLNKFLEFFDCDPLDGDAGEDFGWQEYLGEAFYGYSWIDFIHKDGELNGHPVTFIDLPFGPHALTEDEVNEDLAKRLGLCDTQQIVELDRIKEQAPSK